MHISSNLRALALGALLSVSAIAGVSAQDNPTVGGAAMFADKNIIENAVNSADHTTLVAAVQAKEIDPDQAYLFANDKRVLQKYVTDTSLLPKLELTGTQASPSLG